MSDNHPGRPGAQKGETKMKKFLAKMKKDEKGQGLVEYALIIFLVSIAAVLTLTALGGTVSGIFTQISNAL